MIDDLRPSVPLSLLVKLASLVVHADEFMREVCRLHPELIDQIDRHTFGAHIADPEVHRALAQMSTTSLVPRKREVNITEGDDYQTHRD